MAISQNERNRTVAIENRPSLLTAGHFQNVRDIAENFDSIPENVRFIAEVLSQEGLTTSVLHIPPAIGVVNQGLIEIHGGHESYTFISGPTDPDRVMDQLYLINQFDPEHATVDNGENSVRSRLGTVSPVTIGKGDERRRQVYVYHQPHSIYTKDGPDIHCLLFPTSASTITEEEFIQVMNAKELERRKGAQTIIGLLEI